jgi:hypothetical protein
MARNQTLTVDIRRAKLHCQTLMPLRKVKVGVRRRTNETDGSYVGYTAYKPVFHSVMCMADI